MHALPWAYIYIYIERERYAYIYIYIYCIYAWDSSSAYLAARLGAARYFYVLNILQSDNTYIYIYIHTVHIYIYIYMLGIAPLLTSQRGWAPRL